MEEPKDLPEPTDPPSDCGVRFQVSATAKTKSEAKELAKAKADGECKRLNKGCNKAQEEKGEFHGSEPEVTYVAVYVCAEL